MGCRGCRSTAFTVTRTSTTTVTEPGPCEVLVAAGDALLVEVLVDGTLVPRSPYSAPGYGLGRAVTVLGCRSPAALRLQEIELTLKELLTEPRLAVKFRTSLSPGLVTVRAVVAAMATARR